MLCPIGDRMQNKNMTRIIYSVSNSKEKRGRERKIEGFSRGWMRNYTVTRCDGNVEGNSLVGRWDRVRPDLSITGWNPWYKILES